MPRSNILEDAYNNVASGLTASTIQDAIDEVNTRINSSTGTITNLARLSLTNNGTTSTLMPTTTLGGVYKLLDLPGAFNVINDPSSLVNSTDNTVDIITAGDYYVECSATIDINSNLSIYKNGTRISISLAASAGSSATCSTIVACTPGDRLEFGTANDSVANSSREKIVLIQLPSIEISNVAINNTAVSSSNGSITNIIKITQADYNALGTPNPTTFYIIEG